MPILLDPGKRFMFNLFSHDPFCTSQPYDQTKSRKLDHLSSNLRNRFILLAYGLYIALLGLFLNMSYLSK
jgi:hypothetical protein